MQTIKTRIDFFKERPGMVIAELGVFMGHFSRELLSCNPALLWLVDIWYGPMSSGINDSDTNIIRIADMSLVYDKIMKEFTGDNVKVYRGLSTDFLDVVVDNSLDCVYIDTDHSFEQTIEELTKSRDKVKPDGWITGHDYNVGGVRLAVDQFCELNGLQTDYLSEDKFTSFYIKNIK